MNTFKTDRNGPSSEERKALRAKMEQVNAEAKANWYDDQWRREMAQAMTEEVWMGFQHENLISLMSELETVNPEDRIFMKEVRGLRAFWVSRGGNIEVSTLTEQVRELLRDLIGFHISELELKMEANFCENQTAQITNAITSMDAEINLRVLRTFQAAIPDISSPYFVTRSGLTLPDVNTMITEVQEESLQEEVVLLGRATMTNQIMDAIQNSTLFAPATQEQIVRQGVLGSYRGASIVKLKNYKDYAKRSFFPANELWAVGKDASKAGFWGGLTAKEWTEPGGWYWHYMGRREFGFMVHHALRLRRFVDTGKAA